ncbi:MAG: glycosyltransferase family 4 protein [Chloroflexota bacterium]|nr:glycosyltransferase family 4 protein [Chloroflexota bacterium]
MDRRLKVALVSFDFGEYCIRLASALAVDAEVALLLPEHEAAGYRELLAPAVRFHPFEKPRLRQAARQLRTVGSILRRVRRFDPDVVHVQQGHLWLNLILPFLGRSRLVLTVHDPHHHLGDMGSQNTPQAVMDFGFRRAARLIVHSRQLRQVLVGRCPIPESIVDVIPHIALGDAATPARSSDDGRTVLFFGRIWPYKGLEYLIRAEPPISAAVPGTRFVVAGEGEDFARYRRVMANPERFVVWNEFVSDEQRAELFEQASVVVLPYVEASQSGVIPLAYRFGKPVVATTVGGLPEAVDDGETGYLVPPRDERALAEAVIRLLREPALREWLGANGRRKLDADAAPAVIARQTLAVYRRVLDPNADARLTGAPRASVPAP